MSRPQFILINVFGLIALVFIGLWATQDSPLAFRSSQEQPDPAVAGQKIGDIGNYLFVPNRGSAVVTLIDVRTNRVAAKLELGGIPDQILVSDRINMLVASHVKTRSLSLVDLESQQIAATIPLALSPEHIVLSPDGWSVAAADPFAGVVSIVSLMAEKEVAVVEGLRHPDKLTFSLDGSLVYVSSRDDEAVNVIDIVQGRVIDRVPVTESTANTHNGDAAQGYRGVTAVTRTANGRFGFAADEARGTLTVLDLGSNEKIKTLRVGRRPSRAYGTADGRYMMVPNQGDRTVSVIGTDTLEVIATLPGADRVTAINTGWFESVAFVMSESENKAVVLDLMELRKAGEVSLPGSPGAGVVTPDGLKLFVALKDTNQVAVIDTRTHKLAALIDGVGVGPWGVVMARSNNYCH